MASPAAKKILIEDFGYQPVDIESKSAYSRAVRETVNKLKLENPKDPRIKTLQDAVRPSRKRTTKKESTKKESTQPKKTKDDAIKFIRGRGTPEPVEPTTPTIPKFGGAKTGAALTSISQTVNAIKKLVTRQNKFEKDKADDTREAREKKKRSMAENLMEGGKKMYDKVAGSFGKVLEPAKGIFSKIFDFLKLFILGSGLMMLLNWMGNPENSKKIESIFRFLKDWWPVLVAGLMALFPGVALIPGLIALTVGFLPKLIDTVKMLFGFGKDVDKELAKNEKDLEKGGEGGEVNLDTEAGDEKEGEVKPETTPRPTGEETGGKNLTEPKRFNQGGEVPGQGNEDTVPAMLTPGEFVLTKDAVNQVGADTLYNMNAAAGGTGKPKSGKQPDAVQRHKKAKISTVGTMMDIGGLSMGGMRGDIQSYKFGGMVSNFISKTPQARALRFARNQIRKLPVPPPAAKALTALKKLGSIVAPSPSPSGGDMDDSITAIPSFDVTAPGGRAKEQTLGIRR